MKPQLTPAWKWFIKNYGIAYIMLPFMGIICIFEFNSTHKILNYLPITIIVLILSIMFKIKITKHYKDMVYPKNPYSNSPKVKRFKSNFLNNLFSK